MEPYIFLRYFEFDGIENCTLILFVDGQLHECIWDGKEINVTRLDESKRYIWSSVTLYDDAMIMERKQWFEEFITTNPSPSQQHIIDFQTNTGKGNDLYGLKMNRGNLMLTVSITSAEITEENTLLQYIDCLKNGHTIHNIQNALNETITND